MKNSKKILSVFLALFLYITPLPVYANSIYDVTAEVGRNIVNIVIDEARKGLVDIIAGTPSSKTANSLQGKVIVVDAGHGGSNPGAVYHNSREADNNLATAKKLETVLKNKGATVIMTRTDDVNVKDSTASLREELAARVAISENNNADLFVSLHNNASTDSSADGAITFYYKDAEKAIAEAVQASLVSEVKMKDKGVSRGDFHVLRENDRPSILIELGFISNLDESIKLRDSLYQNKLAYAIGKGIDEYFKNH